jgi:prevent-host-death family protein
MRTIAVTEFKAKLSESLRLVEGGEILTITDHNRSVAIVQAVAEPLVEYAAKAPFRAEPVQLSRKHTSLAATLLEAERGEG